MLSFILASLITSGNLHTQDMFIPRQLTRGGNAMHGAGWSNDNTHLVYHRAKELARSSGDGIWKVSTFGKEVRILKGNVRNPELSPDGSLIAYSSGRDNVLRIVDANQGKGQERLKKDITIPSASFPRWSPDGSAIAYTDTRSGSLCRYDMASGRASVLYSSQGSVLIPGCWCPDGSGIMVACENREDGSCTMFKITSDGRFRIDIICHRNNFSPNISLSPDGSMMVYTASRNGVPGLYIMPSGGGRSLPLATSDRFSNEAATWSPDGTMISFISSRSGGNDIWLMNIDIDKIKKELGIVSDTTQFDPI